MAVQKVLGFIRCNGFHINPVSVPVQFTDASDKCFYDAALSSGAWLVTGNKRHFPNEPFIVTPAEYLAQGSPLRTPCSPRLKSADVVIVVTVFTQRQRVRIISARYATKKEEKRYWAKRFGY